MRLPNELVLVTEIEPTCAHELVTRWCHRYRGEKPILYVELTQPLHPILKSLFNEKEAIALPPEQVETVYLDVDKTMSQVFMEVSRRPVIIDCLNVMFERRTPEDVFVFLSALKIVYEESQERLPAMLISEHEPNVPSWQKDVEMLGLCTIAASRKPDGELFVDVIHDPHRVFEGDFFIDEEKS